MNPVLLIITDTLQATSFAIKVLHRQYTTEIIFRPPISRSTDQFIPNFNPSSGGQTGYVLLYIVIFFTITENALIVTS